MDACNNIQNHVGMHCKLFARFRRQKTKEQAGKAGKSSKKAGFSTISLIKAEMKIYKFLLSSPNPNCDQKETSITVKIEFDENNQTPQTL